MGVFILCPKKIHLCFSWKVHMFLTAVACFFFASVLLVVRLVVLHAAVTEPLEEGQTAIYATLVTGALLTLTAIFILIVIICLDPAGSFHQKAAFIASLLMMLSFLASLVVLIMMGILFANKQIKISILTIFIAIMLPCMIFSMFLQTNTYFELSILDPEAVSNWR